MGGTAGKTLLALTLAALLALAAVGCGGSSDDSSTAATVTTGAGETTPGNPESDDQGSTRKQPGDDKGGSKQSGDDSSSGGSQSSSAGEGSTGFRTKGGDNSIQDFGDEADAGEREAAEANVEAYLEARAKGNWAKSCELLAAGAVKPLKQLAQSSPQLKGKGCAAIIGALSSQLPASSRANPLTQGIASLRVEGDQGFALFHGPHGTDFFIPLAKEGDQWKAAALAASEFP
jgi:hypothetical protein